MLEKDIIKLGLSDKEAKVYLASLELGPSPVQAISQKAKVNRATTYVIIDSLTGMGLMSTYDEGKKTFFTAEQPDRLWDWLKNKEVEAQNKIKILKEKMPELKSLANPSSNKPKVKYFEGLEGLKTVQCDFLETLREGDVICTFLPYDQFHNLRLENEFSELRHRRLTKKIKTKIIYTSKFGRRPEYEKESLGELREYKFVDYEAYPFSGGMNVYGSKVFMIDYLGKTGGIVIENKTMADMLRAFFQLVWNLREK